jgi:hypothetical protein
MLVKSTQSLFLLYETSFTTVLFPSKHLSQEWYSIFALNLKNLDQFFSTFFDFWITFDHFWSKHHKKAQQYLKLFRAKNRTAITKLSLSKSAKRSVRKCSMFKPAFKALSQLLNRLNYSKNASQHGKPIPKYDVAIGLSIPLYIFRTHWD